MIIRAASDDSDSDESLVSAQDATSTSGRSVFDPPYIPTTSSNDSTTRSSWFIACGAVIVLLLVDMAAFFDSSLDVFALLPLLKSLIMYQESIVFSPLASLLNQIVGLTLVGVWIYSREKRFDTTPGLFRGPRYGLWTVGALFCLGHIVSCLYLLFALMESNGDWTKFWLGRRKPSHQTHRVWQA